MQRSHGPKTSLYGGNLLRILEFVTLAVYNHLAHATVRFFIHEGCSEQLLLTHPELGPSSPPCYKGLAHLVLLGQAALGQEDEFLCPEICAGHSV